MSRIKVAGYGDLIFDHYFQKDMFENCLYIDSRGGGPVWNIISNLSNLGVSTIGYGVGGDDAFGHLALHDLECLGVQTEFINLVNKNGTKIIFEDLQKSENTLELPRHQFQARCLVCGQKIEDDKKALLRKHRHIKPDIGSLNYLIVDGISKDRLLSASDAQSCGVITCLDLGRLSVLRYMPISAIVSAFNSFDIVIMPFEVKKSLIKRLSLNSFENILEVTQTRLFILTDSQKGALTYYKNSKGISRVEVNGIRPTNRVDGSGAGDYFFALLVKNAIDIDIHNRETLRGMLSKSILESIIGNSINGVVDKLFKVGARGHLPKKWTYPFAGEEYKGREKSDIMELMSSKTKECIFCGSPIRNSKKQTIPEKCFSNRKVTLKQNTFNYLIKRAFFTMQNKDAIKQCEKIPQYGNTAFIIGTGGSYSVAEYIAISLRVNRNIFAQAIKPYDYIQSGSQSDIVIVISYSGNTRDCGECISHAKKLKVKHVILLTNSENSKLSLYLEKEDYEITYSSSDNKKERGFVSIAGTVAPAALWCASIVGLMNCSRIYKHDINSYSIDDSIIKKFSNYIKQGAVVNIFGTGWAKPAALDLESKFTEGNLAIARFHENKDFSHGRFMSIFNSSGMEEQVSIVIRCGNKRKYEDALIKRLEKHNFTVEIKPTEGIDEVMASLEVLVIAQFFIAKISEKLSVDISRPGYNNINKDGLFLYKWSKEL